uniref:PfkB domain-containing protein n=1 Tax=Globodera pallida TaxID=36090 RepID=A0A183BJE7_GLOPA
MSSSSQSLMSNGNHGMENGLPSPDLIVFGSIVQDLVSYVERFPKPGESVRGHTFKTFCGGKGANQAVMAARLGTRVSMVGMVGDDLFADENLRSIAQNGVDVSLVQQLAGQTTGTATITVSADGENCIVVSLGANNELGVERAHAVEQAVARARLVLCQQEIDQAGTLTLFRIAKRHGEKEKREKAKTVRLEKEKREKAKTVRLEKEKREKAKTVRLEKEKREKAKTVRLEKEKGVATRRNSQPNVLKLL